MEKNKDKKKLANTNKGGLENQQKEKVDAQQNTEEVADWEEFEKLTKGNFNKLLGCG